MTEATVIRVQSPAPYDVVVGVDLLGRLPDLVGGDARRVALVFAAGLEHLAGAARDVLAPAYDVLDLPVPAGEAAKTAEVAARCWEALGAAGLTRSDAVVAVGGGATTDLGGFVAATWLRGVRVVHLPTTLLAMVDAAVGGKTGIDTAAGKNLVGAIHEPAGVLCDLDLLAGLPVDELRSGLGEVVKCGFVADPEILRVVEAHGLPEPASPELRELVERAVRVKAEVVARDLRERGGDEQHPGREVLNYGHTMGHAVEQASGYTLRHGEAVAIGCVYVAELARAAGVLADDVADRHRAVFERVGLPTQWSGASYDDLRALMAVDKKSRGSSLRFVVLGDLARPRILADPPEELLRTAYDVMTGDAGLRVLVLNGPNLGRLGRREPEIYGSTTYTELVARCEAWGRELGLEVEVRQTNHEGELLDWLNAAADDATPVVLNAGAWTHYSLALYDACAQLSAPLVEVHLSDPAQRPEEFRHHSVVTPHADLVVAGHGVDGYREALAHLTP